MDTDMDAMNAPGVPDARDGSLPFAETVEPRGDGNGSPAPDFGRVFVLAAGGLRHMGRPSGMAAQDEHFLGHAPEDLFWKDLLDLVHPDEVGRLRTLVSDVMGSPGVSVGVRLRVLDGLGRWRPAEAVVMNVIEAPGGADGGLLVVNVRDLSRHAA